MNHHLLQHGAIRVFEDVISPSESEGHGHGEGLTVGRGVALS